jgi:hypothetical protein
MLRKILDPVQANLDILISSVISKNTIFMSGAHILIDEIKKSYNDFEIETIKKHGKNEVMDHLLKLSRRSLEKLNIYAVGDLSMNELDAFIYLDYLKNNYNELIDFAKHINVD